MIADQSILGGVSDRQGKPLFFSQEEDVIAIDPPVFNVIIIVCESKDVDRVNQLPVIPFYFLCFP